jgi:hypothetical protein
MSRFKIHYSYSHVLEPGRFVFEGELVEGSAKAGMKFRVPEAGHTGELLILSIEFIPRAGGRQIMGLTVKNTAPGYLPGLGAGQTAELYEE